VRGGFVGDLLLVTTALVVRRHTRLCRGSLTLSRPEHLVGNLIQLVIIPGDMGAECQSGHSNVPLDWWRLLFC
jgi:hypothetical protein